MKAVQDEFWDRYSLNKQLNIVQVFLNDWSCFPLRCGDKYMIRKLFKKGLFVY